MQIRHLCTLFLALLLVPTFGLPGATAAATAPISQPEQTTVTDAAVDATATPTELLVFDVNRKVTKGDRGFPWDDPPRPEANGNWSTPSKFSSGTLHYRVEIRHQPQPQPMQLQFCVWQDNLVLENCGSIAQLTGNPGTVVTWSDRVNKMYKKNGVSIDWTRPRQRYALAIKNRNGLPVSSFSGWNWHGEDPALWYPLNIRFTVVVVARGKTFSGWHNYVGGAGATAPATAAAEALTIEDTLGTGLRWEALQAEAMLPTEERMEIVQFLPLVVR